METLILSEEYTYVHSYIWPLIQKAQKVSPFYRQKWGIFSVEEVQLPMKMYAAR